MPKIERLLVRRKALAEPVLRVRTRAEIDVHAGVANDLPGPIGQRADVVEAIVGAHETILPHRVEQHRGVRPLEFGGDHQTETPGECPIVAIDRREHAKRHELVIAAEIFVLQPR